MQNSQDEIREILLNHARHPRHTGELSDADGVGQCHNPLCGDKVSVSILVEESKIKLIRILPSGCSISIASASLMSEAVLGLSINETESMIKLFSESMVPSADATPWPAGLEKLSPLKRIRENTMKIPCTLISWLAVKEAVNNFKTKE